MMEFAFSKIIMNSTLGFSVTFRNIAFKKNLMTTSSESVCLVVSTRFTAGNEYKLMTKNMSHRSRKANIKVKCYVW